MGGFFERGAEAGDQVVRQVANEADYFSFISLYITCLRATGSNFMI